MIKISSVWEIWEENNKRTAGTEFSGSVKTKSENFNVMLINQRHLLLDPN